ncbi:NeuD/PglB/VioB family sugar acetyltransferase [Georgenia deserti]|uniref:NeuD/PglB/VioB family sugar acetyltransferase n=1 Tax=Georgenia deserti TaxID=2093781 RepID=A0ABW4L917_9MICO
MSILLLGASGLAREVLAAGLGEMTDVAGVLDDDPARHGTICGGVPVLGGLDEARRRQDQLLVCVGSGRRRREIVRRLTASGVRSGRYATFVAPGALIGGSSTVGVGAVLLPGAVVTADASVGQHVVVMPGATITHDDRLDDFTTLAAGVSLGGGVHIGEAAYLGMNAAVHPGITVGARATVGMGAAVLHDVPADQTWVGVPARPLSSRTLEALA